METLNPQPDFFPSLNRRVTRQEAPPMFERLKAEVGKLEFATDLARLCFSKSGMIAHMMHKNGDTGCLRCGMAYPAREARA